jgi:GTP pyrophosphokinase
MEHGGDEDEQIAALLHDTVEDCGGAPVLDRVGCIFGARVARIVEGCSDTLVKPKPDWHARKSRYLARLLHADPSVKLVCAADKLHNLRCTVDDVRRHGAATMERFNASPDHVQWYYAACAAAVADSIPPALRDALMWARDDLRLLLAIPQGRA